MAGSSNAPTYYRTAQFWTDSKLGGCFGAVGQSDVWKVGYWKKEPGEFHPDARLAVEQELPPGTRWTAINASKIGPDDD